MRYISERERTTMKYIRGLLIFALGFVVGIVAMFVWLHRYAPSTFEECVEAGNDMLLTDPPQCRDFITGRSWIGPRYSPIPGPNFED